jgi:hypothetical protein
MNKCQLVTTGIKYSGLSGMRKSGKIFSFGVTG